MRGRVEQLLGMPGGASGSAPSTASRHRLLRLHWREAGLLQGFQILDSEDQQRLIKKVIRAQNLDDHAGCRARCSGSSTRTRTRACARKTSRTSDDPTRRSSSGSTPTTRTPAPRRAWSISPSCCCVRSSSGATTPALLAHYRQRFRHVLVDEFQDTNSIQYGWSSCWSGRKGYPFVVGDDDQSIYRWRGAASRICTSSGAITRPPCCAAWSRTTAPPRPFSRRPTGSSP